MLAASGTSSYACFIYGTIPSALIMGGANGATAVTRVIALGLLTTLTILGEAQWREWNDTHIEGSR